MYIIPTFSQFMFDVKGPRKNQFIVQDYNFNDKEKIRIHTKTEYKYSEEKLLTDIGYSIKEYYHIIKELKDSGIFETVDWKSFNDDILSDLCLDGTIDGELAEDFCSPFMKQIHIDLLLNGSYIDLDKIIKDNNNDDNSQFKIYKSKNLI